MSSSAILTHTTLPTNPTTHTAQEAEATAVQSTHFQQLLELALNEDIEDGDVTSLFFIEPERELKAFIVARDDGIIAGVDAAVACFRKVDPELDIHIMIPNGSQVASGAHILSVKGKARSVLTAERTALNFMQRLGGIATLTRRYVDAVSDSDARILDTRKTTPGFRALEKAAVLAGGGGNHRMGLYDRAMVKDNHLAALGSDDALQASIYRLKEQRPKVEVQLEADTLDWVERFLKLEGVDHILLDNMSNEELRQAVEMRGTRSSPFFEASGGITLETVAAVASTGVDFISIGALTHSAASLDLGLDILD